MGITINRERDLRPRVRAFQATEFSCAAAATVDALGDQLNWTPDQLLAEQTRFIERLSLEVQIFDPWPGDDRLPELVRRSHLRERYERDGRRTLVIVPRTVLQAWSLDAAEERTRL